MNFLLAAITVPDTFPGEAECLEGLLEAGLQRLHLRKPAAADTLDALLRKLSSRWHSRLVLHGNLELAAQYGISQIHGPVRYRKEKSMTLSTSVHTWEEVKRLPDGLAYTFLSPLFNSISKPGYRAQNGLLQRPPGAYPCPVIGMGGIAEDTIQAVLDKGWEGAAVLGWLWEEPRDAVRRFERIQKIVDAHAATA